MNRTRDYYRKQRAKHIARKKRIIRGLNGYWGYEHEGELAKGKIHCSCPWCRCKSYDHKAAKDLARIEAMNESEAYLDTVDYYFEETLEEYLQNEKLIQRYSIDDYDSFNKDECWWEYLDNENFQ